MRSLSGDRCTYCFAPIRLAAVLELPPQQIVDRLPAWAASYLTTCGFSLLGSQTRNLLVSTVATSTVPIRTLNKGDLLYRNVT